MTKAMHHATVGFGEEEDSYCEHDDQTGQADSRLGLHPGNNGTWKFRSCYFNQ